REDGRQPEPARDAGGVIRGPDAEDRLRPLDLHDLPGTTSEPEGQRPPVAVVHHHELRLDEADLLLAMDDVHHGRGREYAVEVEEVLPAVELLATLAERETAVCLMQDVALEHRAH